MLIETGQFIPEVMATTEIRTPSFLIRSQMLYFPFLSKCNILIR